MPQTMMKCKPSNEFNKRIAIASREGERENAAPFGTSLPEHFVLGVPLAVAGKLRRFEEKNVMRKLVSHVPC